jgi:hypothetical protein
VLVALIGADLKPNFHRNNDRKSGSEIQENVTVSICPGGTQRMTLSTRTRASGVASSNGTLYVATAEGAIHAVQKAAG